MATFSNTSEFREAEFIDVDMSGVKITDGILSGMQLRGVQIETGEISGEVVSLTINGVDVAPLVEAELDRRHPERLLLRATTPEGLREAWAVLEAQWAQTLERASHLPPADLDRSVNGEWSLKQTLRHLVCATDSWLSHAILGEEKPFHPMGLIFTGGPADDTAGIDVDYPFDEIVAVRQAHQAKVKSFLDGATQEDLERRHGPFQFGAWPPPAARTALQCLHVILNEEWWHNRFATRDLDVITGG